MNYSKTAPSRASHLEPIADLVARIDLPELVAEAAGPGRQRGETFTFSCPSPNHSDSTPSFCVRRHEGRQRYRCFGCGATGDAMDYVQWIHGLDRTEAIKWLRNRAGGEYIFTAGPPRTPVTTKRTTAPAKRDAPIPTGEKQLNEMGRELVARHAQWRGWPTSVAEAHGLHTVVTDGAVRIRHPFYVPRVTGPIMLGWQDRQLHTNNSKGPKWLAPSGFALTLWGTCSLATRTVPAVVICEGPADGITASYALSEYLPGVAVVAVPGTSAWRPEWSPLFKGLHVVTAADPDPSGEILAENIRTDLAGIAASVTPASRDLLTVDLCDALKAHGPHYVAAALLEPLHLLEVIPS